MSKKLAVGLSLALGFSLSCAFVASAQISVPPTDTDPSISATYNNPHLCSVPQGKARGELLVFLPGTHGTPRLLPFLQEGAHQGYHFVSLMYPDDLAAQTACSMSDDPNAYLRFREEIIRGGDLSPLVHVDRADSIENRLQKLIAYLAKREPDQGWNQFLTKDGGIDWSKVVITGHSQGGGHAYVISKLHKVARVVMFGSPKDFSHALNGPAGGFDTNNATPASRYFAFNHMQDAQGACNHNQQLRILNQMGLTALGQANVDNCSAPYNHAHLLYTNIQLADSDNMKAIHSSVVNPRNGVLFSPVYRYLLTEPVQQ